jgi:hypothetical protein
MEEATIKNMASDLCEEQFQVLLNDKTVGFCPAWWRMTILDMRGLVKKRSLEKKVVYELLPVGEEIAVRLLSMYIVISTLRMTFVHEVLAVDLF